VTYKKFDAHTAMYVAEIQVRKDEFAKKRSLKEAGGDPFWGRLIGKRRPAFGKSRPLPLELPATDHSVLWNNLDGEARVFQSQPYNLSLDEMNHITEIAVQFNLGVAITANGFDCWHYPGGVMSVYWWEKGENWW